MSDMIFVVRDDLNRVTFDSRYATCGVCLGIYHVPYEATDFNFPDFVGRSGFIINISGGNTSGNGGNLNYGWLQFHFPQGSGPMDVALFAR